MDTLNSTQKAKMLSLSNDISEIIRKTIHLQTHDSERFRTDYVVDNLEVRVCYLNNELTEQQFASKVYAGYKAYEKKKDIADVIQLQVQGVTDIIYRILHFLKNQVGPISDGFRHFGPISDSFRHLSYIQMDPIYCDNLYDMFSEVKQLTEYSNGILQEHAKTYASKTWKIEYNNDSS